MRVCIFSAIRRTKEPKQRRYEVWSIVTEDGRHTLRDNLLSYQEAREVIRQNGWEWVVYTG